ncbi:MAG: NAD-dependent epimerase/dehydratase family protein [Clostridiaceae bacterium]
MKILVTGSKGFIGRNLINFLKNKGYDEVLEFDIDSDKSMLEKYARECDFVFHLAGVNRPKNEIEYIEGNFGFTSQLLELLKKSKNKSTIVATSSIQAALDNPYGKSKKACEVLLLEYSKETNTNVLIYRLPNVFGKWCRPNYNSVVATFCYNISRDMEIQFSSPEAKLSLCYIDDILEEFLKVIIKDKKDSGIICNGLKTHNITLEELANKLYSFKNNRETLIMPSLKNKFDKALYATFLSYFPSDKFSYKLKKSVDSRGNLYEFIKSEDIGQIFISKTKPGITRGNHWHHTKVEKFLVIQGQAAIKFRKVDSNEVIEYKVDGELPEVVDIPAGYTHSITNIGKDDLLTLFWACEIFNPETPDTYFLNV